MKHKPVEVWLAIGLPQLLDAANVFEAGPEPPRLQLSLDEIRVV